MTTTEENPTAAAMQKRRQGRFILIIMALLFSAPFISSWFILNYTDLIGRMSVSHGDLYDPLRPLPNVPVYNPLTDSPEMEDLHGRWILLYIAAAPCDAVCEENLYRMRQIRRATGRYTHNLERVWMTDIRNQADLATLLENYEGTLVLDMMQQAQQIQAADFDYDAAANAATEDSLYVIDPLGNLILRYTMDVDPLDIIKDLNKLLKASRIG